MGPGGRRFESCHPDDRRREALFAGRLFGIENFRGVAQLVAHLVWDQGVAGSNPVTPTIMRLKVTSVSLFIFTALCSQLQDVRVVIFLEILYSVILFFCCVIGS